MAGCTGKFMESEFLSKSKSEGQRTDRRGSVLLFCIKNPPHAGSETSDRREPFILLTNIKSMIL